MTSTTIKVSLELRRRVQQHALDQNVSQATVLEQALDLLDKNRFFTQLRRDVVETPEDEDERRDREAWLSGPIVADGAAE